MSRLDWYIARQVLAAMLLVLLVLAGLDLLLTTVDELGNTEAGYGAWQVLHFMLYTTPRHIYELLPLSALIGALAGLGSLAAANELVGMQAAGYSRWQITRAVMQPAMLVMVVGLVMGEYVAPRLEVEAQLDKKLALGLKVGLSRYGHWQRDGGTYVHFNSVETSGVLHGVTLFEFDREQRLLHQVTAESATYQGMVNDTDDHHRWLMQNGIDSNFSYTGEEVSKTLQKFTERPWQLDLTPDLLQELVIDPDDMSISELWRFANRFVQQGLESANYFQGFWRKALQPLNTGVLVFLAVSFIFGPLRSATMGSRVFIAICLGLVVTIGQKLLQNLGLVYHLPPLSTVLLPILLSFLVGIVLLNRRV